MNEEIEFQPVIPTDYETLTQIMTTAFNEDTSMHTDCAEDGPDGYSDGTLVKKLNEHENFESCKILFHDKIVGAFTVGVNPRSEYTLEMLYIDPSCRKGHLGSIVWKGIERKYAGARKWTLETPDYSKRNHYFYREKCGFTFIGEHRFPNGAKSYVFEKTL